MKSTGRSWELLARHVGSATEDIGSPRQATKLLGWLAGIPIAAIGNTAIGDAGNAADRVRCQRYRVTGSDVDFLGNLNGIIDLDTEIANRALYLRMSEQELDPVDQHGFRPAQRMRAELRRVHSCTSRAYCPVVKPPRSPRPAKRDWPGLRAVKRRYSSIAWRV